MKKVLYWIPTTFFLIAFIVILLVFHPLQVIALRFGYSAHNKVVEVMVSCLLASLWLVGKPLRIRGDLNAIPMDKPLIIICNHASMFDIPVLARVFRKFHPKFISKKELAFGIPSVSYNIRHGGSAYIDRGNRREALLVLKKMGEYIENTGRSVVIFPEGTRSKTGELRRFKDGGIQVLLKSIPNAMVVPVAIKNSYIIEKYKMKPIPFGDPLICTVLPTIDRHNRGGREITQIAEQEIQKALNS